MRSLPAPRMPERSPLHERSQYRRGPGRGQTSLEANSFRNKMNKAIFLDRDGTLMPARVYICDFSQVGFFPFAVDAVRTMNRAGYLVIVASNQSAVARGICSERQI